MRGVDALRAPLRRLAREPTFGKAARVLGLGLAAALAGFVVLAGAFLAAHAAYDECPGARDPRACVAERLPLIRAPLVAAALPLLASGVACAALLGGGGGLLVAAFHERRRRAEAAARLARLEDAYARGALSEETFREARGALTLVPAGEAARHEARAALGAVVGLLLVLPPLVGLAWFAARVPWNNSREAALPGGGPLALAAAVAAFAWLAAAGWRARSEARARGPAEREALERLWARVLDESRARSLARVER